MEFSNQLRSASYRSPVNYLTERGIKSETQDEFGLGYAGSIKDLIVALKKKRASRKRKSPSAPVSSKKRTKE